MKKIKVRKPNGIIALNNRFIVDLVPNPEVTTASGITLISDKKQDQHIMVVVGIPKKAEDGNDIINVGDIVRIAAAPSVEIEHLYVKDLDGHIFALVWGSELGVIIKTTDHYELEWI